MNVLCRYRIHLHDAMGADRGATSVEYALIASLIAVVILVAVLLLGTNVFALYDEAASSI